MKVGNTLHDDTLAAVSFAPGYRAIGLHLALNAGDGAEPRPLEVRLDAQTSRSLLKQLIHIHRLAWGDSPEERPLDADADEPRPADLLPSNPAS